MRIVGSIPSGVTAILDQIFWRRFADELSRNPGSAVSACAQGMATVGIICFVYLVGVLWPLCNLAGSNSIIIVPPLGFKAMPLWLASDVLLSALLATGIVRHRYWRYRQTPEEAASAARSDRYSVAAIVGLLLLGGFIVLALIAAATRWVRHAL